MLLLFVQPTTVVDRPGVLGTVRPTSSPAVVPRPYTATSLRPLSGIVIRPDAGAVPRAT